MVKCSLLQLQRVSLAHPHWTRISWAQCWIDAASGTQPHASLTSHTLRGGSRAHFYSLIKMSFNPSHTQRFPKPLKGLLILDLPSNLEILLKNEGGALSIECRYT